MKTLLILVGKTTDRHLSAGIDDYRERISHYMPFEVVVIPELKNTKAMSHEQQREREGEMIARCINPQDTVVLLDERGQQMTSPELAAWLQKKQQGTRRMVMVIGGPYGFDRKIYDRADEMLALSQLTFSHQMVRLILTEQIYRACTILKGEKYHHE